MSIQDAKECPIPTVELPFELTHHIIASLDDRTDRRNYQKFVFPALDACSLVCRAWNDICRPLIFHTVTVDLCLSQRRDSRLSFLHFTAPHLYRYITNLTIFWDRDIYDAPGWIPDTFPRFVNLRSLCLESRIPSAGPILPAPFALGIMTLLDKAPLKSLSLAFWEFLVDASDLLLLLSVCSTTLEEFSLNACRICDSGTMPKQIVSESRVPPVVRLDALRNFKLHGGFQVPQTSRIESPNLHSLAYEYFGDTSYQIPPWIPASLSELSLKAIEVSDVPNLGQSICPSCLTIDIYKTSHDSFLPVMTWIKNCLQGLPFPNALRQLNIKIRSKQPVTSEKLYYPARADCERLYSALQPLHKHGALKYTHLNVSTILSNDWTYPDDSTTREVAELKEVFAPLLEAKQLAVDIAFAQWSKELGRVAAFIRTCL